MNWSPSELRHFIISIITSRLTIEATVEGSSEPGANDQRLEIELKFDGEPISSTTVDLPQPRSEW